MKILVVDYIAPIEHAGYVSYHINCLKGLGHTVTVYSHKSFIKACNVEGITSKMFPDFLHCRTNNPYKPILERIQGIIKMLYLSLFMLFKNYDTVIFTSYDIMSFWTFRTSVKTLIVNHNNLTDFNFSLKRFLHKILPAHYTYVALASFIADYLKTKVNHSVVMIPHGVTKVYKRVPVRDRHLYKGRFIYVPTTSSCNQEFLNQLLESEIVNEYLSKTKTLLVIKSTTLQKKYENTVVIDHYIDDVEYSQVMGEAKAVLSLYNDDSFYYRVSAVLMECIGSNIPIISTKNQSYESYSTLFNYNFIIVSPQSFIDCLKSIDNMTNEDYYKDLNDLLPADYWNFALNK